MSVTDPSTEEGVAATPGGAVASGQGVDGAGTDRVLTRRFLILWACGWANFLALGAVTPLLPRFVKNSLGYDDLVVGLVVAALAVSAVAIRPAVGPLANHRGRRFVTTAGAAMTAASFALYAVPSLAVVVPARLLTGVGQALFFTGAATMVTELAPDHRRAEAVSYFSIAVYLGTGGGPAIGEWVASRRSIGEGFLVAALLAVIATIVCLRLTETGEPASRAADEAPAERISRIALVPGCVLALGIVSNIVFASFMPLYSDELGMSGAASVYLSYTTVVILVRLFGARLPDILGPSLCGTVATVLIAAGMATMAGLGSPLGLYVGAVTLAAGISFHYPSLMTLVVARTPVSERSSTVATFTMFFDIATGFGGFVMGAVASAAGYRAAFGTAAISAMCALALLQLVVLRRPSE
jgi:MFS family permease